MELESSLLPQPVYLEQRGKVPTEATKVEYGRACTGSLWESKLEVVEEDLKPFLDRL